jgi:hypothetical protein
MRKKYTLAHILPILYLRFKTLKSDIDASHTTIACQIRKLYIFLPKLTLKT